MSKINEIEALKSQIRHLKDLQKSMDTQHLKLQEQFIELKLQYEVLDSDRVLIASQEWKPYATPKPMLVDDITDGVFDLEHPVLGEYEGHFIDKNFEKWTFAREIPTPKYTHEKLVEFVGHEFIHVK